MIATAVNPPPKGSGHVDLAKQLRELAIERKAVILAHNYQVPELQEVADFVGD
ncbi:MAG TPA: quinolinate synthase NadA, partial [Chthoniobacterales bacterium]|nr:quinolinate synthase NadA [Chthoniobacterales bacterium]